MVNDCGNCKHREKEAWKQPCYSCRNTSGAPTKWESPHNTPTNADRVRAMSDEELAEFIVREVKDIHHQEMYEVARPAWLEWLKQPAEEVAE